LWQHPCKRRCPRKRRGFTPERHSITMHKLALALFLLATVGVSAAAHDYSGKVKFDCTPGVDYTASINAYLRRVPNNITVQPIKDTHIMGFKFSPLVLTGMGSLWAYRPYYTFCVDNQTFMETVVFGDDPLTLSVNWKSCTGSRGKLGARVSSSNLRLYFMATPTAEDPTRVILYNIGPDSLDDAHLFLEGAPSGWRGFMDAISVVTMPHIEIFWRRFLRIEVPHILKVDVGV
ncbi:hypothetical protein V5799_027585, partial [Amblyomma americanum]